MTLVQIKPKIADGNSKLGHIPNVSLIPGKDCGNCTSCVKDCYAIKFWKMYPTVKAAWSHNSDMARNQRLEYFSGVSEYLGKALSKGKAVKWFRWHIAGDILDQDYLESMKAIARAFPETKFLAFTKMHHLEFAELPSNLTIVASMWPGLKMPRNVAKLPKAWMQDGSEKRVPSDAIPCPGRCDQCMMCWHLPNIGKDVVFDKH